MNFSLEMFDSNLSDYLDENHDVKKAENKQHHLFENNHSFKIKLMGEPHLPSLFQNQINLVTINVIIYDKC